MFFTIKTVDGGEVVDSRVIDRWKMKGLVA